MAAQIVVILEPVETINGIVTPVRSTRVRLEPVETFESQLVPAKPITVILEPVEVVLGDRGVAVTGPPGPQGPVGPAGAQGPKGDDGEDLTSVVDQPFSRDTLNKLNYLNGYPYITETYTQHEATPQQVRFDDFTDANLIGFLAAPPDPNIYQLDQYYVDTIRRIPVILVDIDPVTQGDQKGWTDATFGEISGIGVNYIGHFPNDAAAQSHVFQVGQIYYDETTPNLRVARQITPGQARVIGYRGRRVLETDDFKSLQSEAVRIQQELDTQGDAVSTNRRAITDNEGRITALENSDVDPDAVNALIDDALVTFIDIEPGQIVRDETVVQNFQLSISGLPKNAYPTVDNFILRVQGTVAHAVAAWTPATGARVISFELSITELQNLLRNNASRATLAVELLLRNGADTVTILRRDVRFVDPAQAPESVSGTPPREITGVANVYTLLDTETEIEVYTTIGNAGRIINKRVLRAELTGTPKSFILDTRNPKTIDGDLDNALFGFNASISGNDVTIAIGTFINAIDVVYGIVSGSAGPPGPRGLQGEDGEKGDPGAQGAQGDPGTDGADGDTGAKGDPGDPGADGSDGAAGAKGEPGDTGPQGPEGPVGPTGPAGADGATGPEGPAGPSGPQGDPGAKGDQGDPGEGTEPVRTVPDYWLLDENPHTVVLHINPDSIPDGTTHLRATVAGASATAQVALEANKSDYAFTWNAANSATIHRAIGNNHDTVATLQLFFVQSGRDIGSLRVLLLAVASVPTTPEELIVAAHRPWMDIEPGIFTLDTGRTQLYHVILGGISRDQYPTVDRIAVSVGAVAGGVSVFAGAWTSTDGDRIIDIVLISATMQAIITNLGSDTTVRFDVVLTASGSIVQRFQRDLRIQGLRIPNLPAPADEAKDYVIRRPVSTAADTDPQWVEATVTPGTPGSVPRLVVGTVSSASVMRVSARSSSDTEDLGSGEITVSSPHKVAINFSMTLLLIVEVDNLDGRGVNFDVTFNSVAGSRRTLLQRFSTDLFRVIGTNDVTQRLYFPINFTYITTPSDYSAAQSYVISAEYTLRSDNNNNNPTVAAWLQSRNITMMEVQ